MIPGLSAHPDDGGGVAPSAMNWADIVDVDSGANAALVVTGIGEPIPFRVSISGVTKTGLGSSGGVYAIVDGVATGIAIVAGNTFDVTVQPSSSVYFSANGTASPAWTITCTVTIKYKSAGSSTFDVTLDTFTVTLSGEGTGGGPPGGGGGRGDPP